MKFCTRCSIDKEDSDFYKNKRTKDGLGVWCKKCEKEFSSDYAKSHREKIRQRHKNGGIKMLNTLGKKADRKTGELNLRLFKLMAASVLAVEKTDRNFWQLTI